MRLKNTIRKLPVDALCSNDSM